MKKRLISEKEIQILKDKIKFKNKDEEDLSSQDIRELVILIAKKLGIL